MPPHSNFNMTVLLGKYPLEQAEPGTLSARGPLVAPRTTTKTTKSARRSVSFDERVRAKKTTHIADFSEEEKKAYWYSEEDFLRMKQDVRFEVNLLENQCLERDTASYCRRGLEYYTSLGSNRRSSNKRKSRNVVLEEQALQRNEGSNDLEYIAEIYAAVVAASRLHALELARQDRLDLTIRK